MVLQTIKRKRSIRFIENAIQTSECIHVAENELVQIYSKHDIGSLYDVLGHFLFIILLSGIMAWIRIYIPLFDYLFMPQSWHWFTYLLLAKQNRHQFYAQKIILEIKMTSPLTDIRKYMFEILCYFVISILRIDNKIACIIKRFSSHTWVR